MKKYIVVNTTACTVECLTEKALMNAYQKCAPTPNGVEPEFQYDEDMGYLFQWQRGQKFVFENGVSPEDAKERLLQWTIRDMEDNADETIRVFTDKAEAIEFIDFSLGFLYEDDDPSVQTLTELKNTLEKFNA